MEPPAVVTLITNLGTQLQSHAASAKKLQDNCVLLGSVAHRLSQLLAAVGATAETATLAELHASQPALSHKIHDLNRELLRLSDPAADRDEGGHAAHNVDDTAGNEDKTDISRSRTRRWSLFAPKTQKNKPQIAQHDQHAASQSDSKAPHTHFERDKNIKDNGRSDVKQLDKAKGHASQGEDASRIFVKGVGGLSVNRTEAGPSSGPSVSSSGNETGPIIGHRVSSSGNETGPSSGCAVSSSGNETGPSSGPTVSSSGNEAGASSGCAVSSSGNETGPSSGPSVSSSGNETGASSGCCVSSSSNELSPRSGPSMCSSGNETGLNNGFGMGSSNNEAGLSSSGNETGPSSSGNETGPSSCGNEAGLSSSGNEAGLSSSSKETCPSSIGNEVAGPSSGPSLSAAGAGTAEGGESDRERQLAERESSHGPVADKMKQVEPKRTQQAKPAEPPDYLLCPISRQMMTDPVVLVESGHTYQAASIKQWLFKNNGRRDPLTNQALVQWPPKLVRNHVVLKAAVDFLQQHPEAHSCLDDESINLDALIKELEQKSSPCTTSPPCTTSSPSAHSPERGTDGPSEGTTGAVIGAGMSEGGSNSAAAPISIPVPASAPPVSASAPGELFSEAFFDDAVANSFAKMILRKKLLVANTTRNNDQHPATSGEVEKAANYPLHWAVEMGWAQLVRALIEQGIEPNRLNQNGMAPLHLAVTNGDKEMIAVLAAYGADVNAQGWNEMAPIHLALDTELVAALLRYGADINRTGQAGLAPLHVAIKERDTQRVKFLLDHGADVNLPTATGCSPLKLALNCTGNAHIVTALLQAGADVSNAQEGGAPLFVAVKAGGTQRVELLLRYGASVWDEMPDGTTPLHVAAKRWEAGAATLLCEAGAVIDACASEPEPNAPGSTRSGVTPLHCAIRLGHLYVVRVLLEKGANANAQDSFGMTALHHAVVSPLTKSAVIGAVRLLLTYGADVTVKTQMGDTAMALAKRGHWDREVVDLLRF